MIEFSISLKPGYQIYAVSVNFASHVYMVPGGFTAYDIFFVVAPDAGTAEALVTAKYSARGIDVSKASAKLACQQDINRYCFADTFPGFADGCVHPEYPASPFSADYAKALVNDTDQFLHKGNRKYADIRVLASHMRSVWATLGYWSKSSCELQASAISVLDTISDGSLTGGSAEETLYGVMGVFNQSLRSVVNFSGSARL